MRILKFLGILILCCTSHVSHAEVKAAAPKITIEPVKPGPGDIMIVRVKGVTGSISGTFNKRQVYFNASKESFKAIVGIDLLTEPGTYALEISTPNGILRRDVHVREKKYGIQRLTLPKDMVELSPEDEARVEREQQKMAAIWPNENSRFWEGNFINPREGEVHGTFGLRRVINKIPKNPHSGIDVAAELGDHVHAPNNGTVALIDDQFYSGQSLILDHGQGIYTMFFHLSKILVSPGQTVKKGDVIAHVGSTGRSTGPHLHWGARIQGARVNPLELIKLKLE